MFLPVIIYSALMAQTLFVVVVESQLAYDCLDIALTEPNKTVTVSSLDWNSTNEESTFRVYCWNLTIPDGYQFQAWCQHHTTEFFFYLILGEDFAESLWFPDEFYAPGPQLSFLVAFFDLEAWMSCSVKPQLDSSESTCGPENINSSGEYPLSISVSGNRLGERCVWLVTGGPGTIIYIDIVSLDLHHRSQQFAFGRGHDPANYSSQFLTIDWTDYESTIGTSFFSTDEAGLWIEFASSLHDDDDNAPATQELLLRFENYTGEVLCRPGQVLCQKDDKCLPLFTFCDGKIHCSDFVDEAGTCDRCGASDISLRFGEPVTILADFEGFWAPGGKNYWDMKYTGHFAIYPGESESIPNDTSSGDVIVSNYTMVDTQLECIWMLTEPQGTRILVRVAEFNGPELRLKMGNGLDPLGVPGVVLDTAYGLMPLPLNVPSIGAGVWVTLEEPYSDSSRFSFKLRLVFTTYNLTECDVDYYACPSGLDCLDNVSHVCDGHRECIAYGDELGCGDCSQWEFKCATSGACVPVYSVCDRRADCQDHSDELMCGFCENETVNLSTNETYALLHDDLSTACLWLFIAEPGQHIQADIRHLNKACTLTLGRGYSSTSPVRQETIREVRLDHYVSYPKTLTTNSSIMWIKIDCGYRFGNLFTSNGDILQVHLRQYTDIECSSDEHMCPSGLRCIRKNALCDGRADCPEYWDEIGCGNCSTSEFSCRSGQDCVSMDYHCDGINDCQDLSDEFECAPCGDSFIDVSSRSSVVLSSPGWPGREYPNNAQCLWLVVAEVGFRVVVSFLDFFLEESYDYLYCGDDDGFQDSFLTVTGDRFPVSVASKNNTMFLKFTSDGSIQERGFQLQVEQKLAQKVSCGEDEISCKADHLICIRNDSSEQGLRFCSQDSCGSQIVYIYGSYEDLTSPGYPNPYPSDIACQWEVRSRIILVSILEFSTETSRDVVRFQGSTLHGGDVVTFELDGGTKVRTIAFNSTSVSISFITDSTVEEDGFRLRLFKNFSANVNTSCPYPELFDCGDGSCVSHDATCDGFKDCQTYGSDELDCKDITCPDFYHCNDSPDCIHWTLVCDGTPHCPHQDDETDYQCDERCHLTGCFCIVEQGTVRVTCQNGWNDTTLTNMVKRTEHLQLSGANVSTLDEGLFKDFSYLKSLRLNNNNMYSIKPGTFFGLTNLTFLDISNNSITSLDASCFLELQSLDVMIAAENPLRVIQEKAFDGLKILRIIVLINGDTSNVTSDATVDVKDGALADLVNLEKLYVDDYRLCCEFVSSIQFDVSNCITTELQPPLNLCGSLMRNTLLRVAMWVLGLSALIGNAVVIVWRCWQGNEKGGKKTHSFFVLNLAVSDLMMGVYMLMIAIADLYFGEKYSRVAKLWRASPVCKIAGVLSVLSSEASVFFVTLISLDSFFAIVFPFSRIRLREKSATVAVTLLWIASVALSIGPTVFVGSDSKVYGLSDVCIGLPLLTKPTSYVIEESDIINPGGTDKILVPVGRGKEPAWIYSIVLFLGVNMLCFLVVLCCYLAIFVKVKRTVSRVRKTAHRDQEIKMAVKMALIVGTDFACWMPVIIMGILSQTGAVDISPDMYAWIVVFILPINSSLNPYMYTFYTIAATRRLAQSAASQRTRFTTEMKTKSLETLHSTISDNKSS